MTAPTTTTLETWTIDASHTHVGFAVRHMMVATAKGTFADVKGTVEFDGANLATATINDRSPCRDWVCANVMSSSLHLEMISNETVV